MRKFILFDFDGVIVDTFEIAFVVHELMFPGLTRDEYRKVYQGNVIEWYEMSKNEDARFNPEINFHTEYGSRYPSAEFFPQMQDVVRSLSSEYNLIIISSSFVKVISGFLDAQGLISHFKEVLGGDVHASKEEKIKMVFEKYGVLPDQCIFVTDTLGDIMEARKVGVTAVGVSWGFNPVEVLEKGEPFRIVHTPETLKLAISDYFSQSVV